ncbi:MAG: hypothetical protein PHX59_10320 [Sulfuricurvum sp.]|nr:hypothetical protein [Sulfuricurvum sp.]
MIDCENCESGLPQDILMKIIKAQTNDMIDLADKRMYESKKLRKSIR